MNRTLRCAMTSLPLVLALGVGAQARQSAEPQAPSGEGQAAREVVPPLPVPRLVKFAGTLNDEQGKPRTGTVGVTFAIYKEQEVGAALWMETQNVQVDEQGHYSVLLGATKSEGLPVELFTAAEPRWLGVQLAGETELARVLLVSVPYALKAADAESLGGKPASAYMLAPEAVAGVDTGGTGGSDTGTGPVQTKNKITTRGGKATPQLITANFVPVFTDSNGTLANSLLVQGGNSMALGQGLSGNASVQFDVNGGIRGTGLATNGRNVAVDAINTGALFLGGSNAMGVVGTNAQFAPGVLFTKTSFFSGALERMTIDGTTGNVGIGTTMPVAKLDINGSLNLPSTVSATVGVISLGGSPFIHNFGNANTFVGQSAGNTRASLTGGFNTAAGVSALSADTTGSNISAFGASALQNNTAGFDNSAFGSSALGSNTTGDTNSAFGVAASLSNTTGTQNAAFGNAALEFNTTGTQNAAFGAFALQNNTVTGNSAFGFKALGANTTGTSNTAAGSGALGINTTGSQNVAFGAQALQANSTASFNSAFGTSALAANSMGQSNSAFGTSALATNTVGSANSAFGFNALSANTTAGFNAAFGNGALQASNASFNSAFGTSALAADTTGNANAAFGFDALLNNTTGSQNAAFGNQALQANTAGGGNSAFGNAALNVNTNGNNAAFGSDALSANITGQGNSAFGSGALPSNTTGSFNIAIGIGAGTNLSSSESNNIDIGNGGVIGESNAIHVGSGQTSTFIAGISGATSSSGIAVFVNSSGQLGTATSSRRFKHAIADMGAESDLLMGLRPVAFYYKPELDETQTRQYGLVAEEVAQVAPDLVVFDKDGQPQTVRYHFINAMLLNEVQKQRRTIQQQQAEIEDLTTRLANLEALIHTSAVSSLR